MGKAGWDVVGAWLVTFLTAGPVPLAAIDSGPVDSQGTNTTISRIRTADPDIARAIVRAAEWSQTFRRLVEAIERTDGLVWVSRARCRHGATACLVTYLIVSGPNRLLHIHVDPRRSDHELMESIGHELQHAVEVLGSSARSTAEMYNFFEYSSGVYRVGDRFETRAAMEAGLAVGREIARARQQKGSAPNRSSDCSSHGMVRHVPAPGRGHRADRWGGMDPPRTVWRHAGMFVDVSGSFRATSTPTDSRRSSRLGDRLMESLGHELQHAVEVLGTSLRTSAGVYHFFNRQAGAYRIGGRFETTEAVQAGLAVAREVARTQQLRAPQTRQP
jgi:hypothetical protein